MVGPAQDSRAVDQARWVFRTLERINAGEVVSPDEVAAHMAPSFLEVISPERMLAAYGDVASLGAQIKSFETEFERDSSISMVATLEDGRRCRWDWTVETEPPHRLVGQLWTGPWTAAATDRVVRGPDAEVLVRDYTDTGAGPERLLLLHCAGGHAGGWDMVASHITSSASIHAMDLRGHGRSDPRHRYSTAGCVADIHAATRGTSARNLVVAGHSLGGHVALQYAAATPCRGLLALDGPGALRHRASEADIATAPEPMKSIHSDLNTQDVGGLIRDLSTPAMFVFCRGDSTWEPAAIEERHQLAEYVTRHGHVVKWIDVADHNFGWNMPELTGKLITDFLATLS